MNKDSEEPIKHYERPSTPRGSVQKTSSAGNPKRRIRSVPSSTVAKRKSKRRSILVLATLVLLFLVCVPLVIAHFTSRSDNDSQKSELVHDRDSKDSHKKKKHEKKSDDDADKDDSSSDDSSNEKSNDSSTTTASNNTQNSSHNNNSSTASTKTTHVNQHKGVSAKASHSKAATSKAKVEHKVDKGSEKGKENGSKKDEKPKSNEKA
ncbi:MAG: hypothetical protein N4P70_01280, partial [Lactobacillus iners]|nr:hypothetical protein [Lactobacillus iners]